MFHILATVNLSLPHPVQFSHEKKKEILLLVTTRMDLQGITLKQTSQTGRPVRSAILSDLTFMWHLEREKNHHPEKKVEGLPGWGSEARGEMLLKGFTLPVTRLTSLGT